MKFDNVPFSDLLLKVVDNRGKTCPTADDGIPLIATNCIKNDCLYPTYENVRYVTRETYDTWFRGHPQPGDIIFVCKGSPGRCNWVPDPIDFCIAQDMVALRVNENKVYPKYLFALLRSSDVQQEINNLHVGTLIPHFKKGDFDKLILPIPEDADLQKFAGDTYFNLSEKIELNRKQNRTLEAIAQALFKRWFVEFEFPDENGRPYKSSGGAMQPSGLGEIPVGWDIGALGDVVEQRNERVAPSQETRDMPYVPIDCISPASLFLQDSKDGEEAQSSLIRFYEDDILFGAMRPYFHKVCIAPFAGTTRTTCFVLKPRSSDDFAYATLLLHDAGTIDFATKHSTGSTIPYAKWEGSLDMMEVVLPPPAIRKDFNELVYPLLRRIPPRYFENRSLAQIRDTLLPQLMSGELRVA